MGEVWGCRTSDAGPPIATSGPLAVPCLCVIMTCVSLVETRGFLAMPRGPMRELWWRRTSCTGPRGGTSASPVVPCVSLAVPCVSLAVPGRQLGETGRPLAAGSAPQRERCVPRRETSRFLTRTTACDGESSPARRRRRDPAGGLQRACSRASRRGRYIASGVLGVAGRLPPHVGSYVTRCRCCGRMVGRTGTRPVGPFRYNWSPSGPSLHEQAASTIGNA